GRVGRHRRARQQGEEQDPRQEVGQGVFLKEKRVLEDAYRLWARRRGEARRQRQVVVDLAAEGEVPPDVAEVPHVRRCGDGKDEGGGPHPRQKGGRASATAGRITSAPKRTETQRPAVSHSPVIGSASAMQSG